MRIDMITTARQRVVVFFTRSGWVATCLGLLAACAAPVRDNPPAAASRQPDSSTPRYRVETFAKVEGQYIRYPNGQVGIGPYRMARVEYEDATSIAVRVYEPVQVVVKPAVVFPPPTADLPESTVYQLQPFDSGLPRQGQWRNDLAIADLDGDGELDIASAPPRKTLGWPIVFRGDGAGNWSRWSVQFPDLGYDYGSMRVADLDGDGRTDLALAMHLRGFTVLRQDAPGQFTQADAGLPPVRKAREHGVTGVQLAWERDERGRALLLLLPEHLWPGSSVTTPRQALIEYVFAGGQWTLRGPQPAPLATADSALLLHADRSLPGTWLLLRSGADYQLARLLAGKWTFNALTGVPAGCELQSAAVADVDGDKEADVAVSCRRRIDPVWWSQVELLRSSKGPLTLQAGTLDAAISTLAFLRPRGSQHAPDLVLLGKDGRLQLLNSDDAGGFRRDRLEPTPTWRAGCQGYALRGVDLDHDGGDEIVASFAGEPSALELSPGCRDNGGISVWKVIRTP